MEDTTILMVVKEPEARVAYEDALKRAGVCYHTAASFQEMLRMTIQGAYSGLMIDILTLIRSSKEEKAIAYDCFNLYPTLRVKWDPRQKCLSVSPQEQSLALDAEGALAHFTARCKSFSARSLRRFNRKDSYLSLRLSAHSTDGPCTGVKTFTVNISRGGAFVHSCEPFGRGDQVWLSFPEDPAGEPVRAAVCWSIAWGKGRAIPGIGVMFCHLSELQASWMETVASP